MLYCLVIGDAIEKSFLVEVSKDLSVSVLRDLIKKNKPDFDCVPAKDLQLWKVNIPVDDIDPKTKLDADAENMKEQLVKENKLSTFQAVGKYFKEEVFSDQQPNNHVIRIIIQPDYATGQKRHAHPEPVELEPKRQKTLSGPFDFNNFIIQLSDNIEVYSPPQLYPESKQGIAGRFRKDGFSIPISGEDYPDMRLNDKNITDMGRKLVEICKNKKRVIQPLYAVSGAGKTRAIFDMAMHENGIFITYIECRPSSGETNIVLEPTLDRNFAQLVDSIESFFFDENININTARTKSKHLIILEFTARVLYLIILKKKYENLTPREYLLAQINRGQKSIRKIRNDLVIYSYGELKLIMEFVLEYLEDNLLSKIGQKSLVFAIDEANIASTKILNDQFLNRNNNPCGLLTPMLEILDLFNISMVIAGTAFSLKQGSNIQSNIGKGEDVEYLTDFKFMTSKEVETYITQHVDLSYCNIDIENWKYLTGRPRLAARLVVEIINAEKNQNTKTKQDVLEIAVDKTVQVFRKAMEKHLEKIVAEAYEKGDYFDKCLQEVLEILFVNCKFFDGYISKSEMDDKSSRLVDCGIALLKKDSSKKYVVVNEPLAIDTVNTVLASRYNYPNEALIKKLFSELEHYIYAADSEKSNTAKGFAWQYLVLGNLMDFNKKKVFDFVNEIYDNQSQLPDWTKNATINIKSYGNLKMLSRLDKTLENVKDDVDVIQKLLQGLTSNYLLVPSPGMHPDGVYISKCEYIDYYWTLLISAKLLSENLSGEKFIKDRLSTDWNITYYQTDGETVNCTNLKVKEKLDDVCEDYHHCGSLRIHFIWPSIADGDQGGCHVEGDDVIMYIDKMLLDRYLPTYYVNFLKVLLAKEKK